MSRSDGTEDPFTPEIVAAVMRHMNEDHADDSLLIVRALGGVEDATSARMRGMDPDAIEFDTIVGDATTVVRVPWGSLITERRQVRAEVTRMYQQACAVLGIEPREGGRH